LSRHREKGPGAIYLDLMSPAYLSDCPGMLRIYRSTVTSVLPVMSAVLVDKAPKAGEIGR